jgi:DNA topoisomerase-1
VVVTDRICETHGLNYIRIINQGKRPWDLGCPHCNFLEWQAKKAKILAEGKVVGKVEDKAETAKSSPKPGPKAKVKAKEDGLVAMAGIGPKTLEKLALAGIKTAEDLLKAEVKGLAEKTGISSKKITAWRRAARAES